MANQPVKWKGASGTAYDYYSDAIGEQTYRDVDGNYIFAKVVNGYWIPVYIGQGNLPARLSSDHHKWDCIQRKGATHIHQHQNPKEADRLAEERDLLAGHPDAYTPQGCNDKTGG